jgi:hypothetical protein
MLDHPCPRHRLGGRLLTGLLSVTLVGAAASKLLATPESTSGHVLATNGVWDARLALAAIDLLLAAGLWPRRTSTSSYVLAVGYWGGAIATHLSHGHPWGLPAGLLVLTLAAAWFRAPELYFRLLGTEGFQVEPGATCARPARS